MADGQAHGKVEEKVLLIEVMTAFDFGRI